MNLVTEDTCTFCKNTPETILHLLWQCEISQDFFRELKIYIENKCNIQINAWGVKEVIFGSSKIDKVQNLILLQAKFYLYYNKTKGQLPSLEPFKKRVTNFYKIEKYNATKYCNLEKFEKLWDKYKNLA